MEKNEKTSTWLACLGLMTLVHTSAFVAVTVVQFVQIEEIYELDKTLADDIASIMDDRRLDKYLDRNPDSEKKEKRATNLITEILQSQEQIIAQHCIDHHKICANGMKGDTGDIGDKGAKGQKGSKGAIGFVGETGAKGVQGDPGVRGYNGSNGDQGTSGSVGSKGQKGDQGAPGDIGPKGALGSPGITGTVGAQGNTGIQGSPGVKGEPGFRGMKGPQGTTGYPGEKGDIGPTGPSGLDVKQIPDGCQCLRNSTFVHTLRNHRVRSGQQTDLSCNVTGNPEPEVRWLKNGGQIHGTSTKRSSGF